MKITLVGHSTVLIEAAGRRIITDPYFSLRGNPSFVRVDRPSPMPDRPDKIDLVLLSHHHLDHIDAAFFRALPMDAPIVSPSGTTWLTRLLGGRTTIALRPWQTRTFDGVKVTATPAVHFIATVGFVIEAEGKCVYFAGDTFHRPFMREISRRFILDAVLIPVATYRLPMTMGESEAVRAVQDLKPGAVIPIHEGIQPRAPFLRSGQSPEGFERRLRAAGDATPVISLLPGMAWDVPAAAVAPPV